MIFLGSATHKTGGANLDVFVIPLIIAIITVAYAIRIKEERYIIIVIIFFLIIGIVSEQGSFLNINLIGASMFGLFIQALRPW
jgi:hypothetical protein